jgi:SAM-dependent methyltransferase
MEKDKERWNKKYLEGKFPLDKPASIVTKYYKLAKTGKALDIAAGLGRNSLFLAEKGFKVDAVDISDVAVEKLSKLHPNINAIQADLDTYKIPENEYDLIININFLSRRLFPYVKEGLKKDGILIFQTFLEEKEPDLAVPSNRDFLLRKNELLHSFLSLRVLFYKENKVVKCGGEKSYLATLVAKKEC